MVSAKKRLRIGKVDQFVGGLPDTVFVHIIGGAGHMAHMEAAAEVNTLISAATQAERADL